MPCEACNIQFTVFKRKKSCTECRRLYCSNCLTKNKERILCKRCVIFTTRPLSKIELLKLKAKDLIFYLQSKHISTTGCVEKEELVNLVLIHVDNSNTFTPDSQQQSPTSISMGISDQSDEDPRSNPFDQIRNTCQNLFTTFTEKIATDFNFDFKQNQSDRPSNVCEDQPRYSNSFRNVPSFNSNLSTSNSATSTTSNNGGGNVAKPQRPPRPTTIQTSSVNQSTQMELPVNSAFSCSNHSTTGSGSGSGQSGHTNSCNSQTSPTITGNSSNASTPLKSISSDDATTTPATSRITPNGKQSPPTVPSLSATTSTRKKPLTCAKVTQLVKNDCCNSDIGSGCECSDDELIAKFRESYGDQPLSPTTLSSMSKTETTTSPVNNTSEKLPIGSENNLVSIETTTTIDTKSSSSSTKTGNNISDESALKAGAEKESPSTVVESFNVPSLEDWGAVGGLPTNVSPNPNDSDDNWQIISPTWNIDDTASTSSNVVIETDKNLLTTSVLFTTNLPNSITELPQVNHNSNNQIDKTQLDETITNDTKSTFQQEHSTTTTAIATTTMAMTTMNEPQDHQHQQQQRNNEELRAKLEKALKPRRQTHRKITRRQSDGIVYMVSTASTSNSSHQNVRFVDKTDDDNAADDDEEECSTSTSEEVSVRKRSRKSCRKCGKTKGDLKKYIARFRHQLETTTTFSEVEIRQRLDAFLEFLENHSALDIKTDEENTEIIEQSQSQLVADAIEVEEEDEFEDDEEDNDDYDDEAGIHVYGSDDTNTTSTHPPRQFFDLNSVQKKEDLDDLSVKQLKEVLMLNRVDFKGCCEKSELLERVQRLWDDLQNCPAVHKLATVDLCKICMDAAIECILLECGHMATCTNCGKVLSECPICRQYIVRVVRFFKA